MFRGVKRKFGKIYDKYVGQIYRFIFLKVNSPEIAEDLTSEVFLKAFEIFKKGEKKIKNERAFLYQIARNLVIDFYRDRAKLKVISTSDCKEIIDESQNLEEKIFLDSEIEKIREAISTLKDEYQDVLLLRYVDNLKIPEIAQILKKSEQNTRVLLHRALKSLKEKIKEI